MEFFSIIVPIVTYDLLENVDIYTDFIKYFTRNTEDGKMKKRKLEATSNSGL